eukprot:gene28868-37879_t
MNLNVVYMRACPPIKQETAVLNSKRVSVTTTGNDVSSVISSSGWGVFAKGLASGSVTRAAKEIVLHPIDTVKSRIQTAAVNASSSRSLLYKDVFNGLAPALVGGIPAGALFFGAKDFLKSALKGTGALSKDQVTILSVVLANIPYWVLRAPSEVLKTKEQVRSVYRTGGIARLWQYLYGSYASNLIYALPADIVKFLAYEKLVLGFFGKESGGKVEGLEAAIAGALAGMIAQAMTTPLDVARTRIMANQGEYLPIPTSLSISSSTTTSPPPPDSSVLRQANIFAEVVSIYRGEGWAGLFAGLSPRLVRAVVSGAVQFATYEVTQNILSKL